ncbi:MAG TPA: AmmeMemoRadiSam system protein B [Bryobacteraceae bacterium]
MLPSLRLNLEFLPSPDPSRPGLLIRDPYQYSSQTLLIPPPLIRALPLLDGSRLFLDLQKELVALVGPLQSARVAQDLCGALDEAGFLENATYYDLKARREAEFAALPKRDAAFAGSAYPADRNSLAQLLALRVGQPQGSSKTRAVAAPHASPDGGWDTYRASYRALPPPEVMDGRTIVVLGTSHYGQPERYGLTRKPFVTPLGEAGTNLRLVDELERAAPGAVCMEDYCHAMEHSIELQIIFLQHLYGPNVAVLPILCGPFAKSLYEGGLPEHDEQVRRFFDALGNMSVREGRKLFWVLGVDMAHMGTRYGDRSPATAKQGEMLDVKQRDLRRINELTAGDRSSYWSLVQENHDDLKWCGSAPLYTFLNAVPEARGDLLHYDQWQIDAGSVVSFAALRFE